MKKRRFITSTGERIVRVVRDPSDYTRDYYISEDEAKERYNKGELCMINVDGNKWDYAED